MDPGLRALLLVQITTLLLVRLRRWAAEPGTFFSKGMPGVRPGWVRAGYGYPSAPLPIALNIASRILAFVAAFTLFVPSSPRRAVHPSRKQLVRPAQRLPG